MDQLLDGASQLVDGAAQLAAGANALNEGAAQLNGGLGQLTGGLDTLTSNNDALKAGARQVADGVLNSANSTLMEGGLIDQPMTWENYASVIDHVLEMGSTPWRLGAKDGAHHLGAGPQLQVQPAGSGFVPGCDQDQP